MAEHTKYLIIQREVRTMVVTTRESRDRLTERLEKEVKMRIMEERRQNVGPTK